MDLYLYRRWFSDKTTIGELFVNPKPEGNRGFECYVLEDKYRGDDPVNKIPKETCIPCGKYAVVIDFSDRFQTDMPHVLDVPGFQGIRIHPGNYAGDTEGCLLPGRERQTDTVTFSRPAYAELCQRLRAALGRGESISLAVSLKSPFE